MMINCIGRVFSFLLTFSICSPTESWASQERQQKADRLHTYCSFTCKVQCKNNICCSTIWSKFHPIMWVQQKLVKQSYVLQSPVLTRWHRMIHFIADVILIQMKFRSVSTSARLAEAKFYNISLFADTN